MSMAGLWPADSDRYHVFTIDYQTIPSLAERAKLLAKHPNGAKQSVRFTPDESGSSDARGRLRGN